MKTISIANCNGCKISFWNDLVSGDIHACPNCFGHKVLDTDRFPTRELAMEAFLSYEKYKARELKKAREIMCKAIA